MTRRDPDSAPARRLLPKAYLRMDPNLDQHPDPEVMVRLMCAAARQPWRGRFKTAAIIDRAVGPAAAQEAKLRGDLVAVIGGSSGASGVDQVNVIGGSWYLQGWDEWQEGDYTVGERVARIRARRAREPVEADHSGVTGPLPERALGGYTAVTSALPDRILGGYPPSDAKDEGRKKVRKNVVPAEIARATRVNGQAKRPDDLRLTSAEARTWSTYGPEWAAFRAAWHRHGFRRSPTGRADDPNSQRGALWPIVSDRPTDVASWVDAAPAGDAYAVVGYVLQRWQQVVGSVPPDPPRAPRVLDFDDEAND